MATMDISPKALERVSLLCRNTVLSKIQAGAVYGAAAYIYKPATVGDLELSSPQYVLLSLLNSLVTQEIMSCCMLAELCYQIQQYRSDHLRVWLMEDFIFPRQDMEKAIALLSKLLATGILKLPACVIKILSSLATNYGIHFSHLIFPSMTAFGSTSNHMDRAVNNSARDITASAEEGIGLNGSTQSSYIFDDLAGRASSSADIETVNSINATPLEEAVKNDSVSSIKDLLKTGAKLNKLFFRGDTYLHIAAGGGLNRALKSLLEAGMNINQQNYIGETPLVKAIRKGNVQGVQMLLNKGANINILPGGDKSFLDTVIEERNVDGDTMFHLVARLGNEEILKVMKGQKLPANIKNHCGLTPLHVTSNPSVVKMLIEMGVDVNGSSKRGKTALHLASAEGNLDLVKVLVQQEADVNKKDRNGITPMMVALKTFNYDIAQYLLHNGANPNTKDKAGRSSLHYAAVEGSVALVSALLDAGARIDDKDNKGNTPALLALDNNKPAALNQLAERDADLTLIQDNSMGVLHRAASNGFPEIVKVLLEVGPLVDEIDIFKRTALHYAAQKGHSSVVSVLLDYGADPGEVTEDNGFTPLMYAALHGRLDVVQLLIARNAWVNARNCEGKTALYFANNEKYGIVADYIKSKGGIL